LDREVVRQARDHLKQHTHFRNHTHAIEVGYQDGRLVLKGRVPSFYLKQVLQTVLRDLPGVSQVDNQVDVVSSCGLSSVSSPPKGLSKGLPKARKKRVDSDEQCD